MCMSMSVCVHGGCLCCGYNCVYVYMCVSAHELSKINFVFEKKEFRLLCFVFKTCYHLTESGLDLYLDYLE